MSQCYSCYGICSGQLLAVQLQELPGTNHAVGPGRNRDDSTRLFVAGPLGERLSMQAQPTWTHWSFPFVSRWLMAKVKGLYHTVTSRIHGISSQPNSLVAPIPSGRSQNGVPTDDIAEDEDLLNVALWHPSCKSREGCGLVRRTSCSEPWIIPTDSE